MQVNLLLTLPQSSMCTVLQQICTNLGITHLFSNRFVSAPMHYLHMPSATAVIPMNEDHFSSSNYAHEDQTSTFDREDHVATLLAAVPGIKTLGELIAIDPQELSPGARIDYLAALERQSSWLQAAMQRAIVAVAGITEGKSDGPFTGVDEAEREDVSSALRLSAGTAQMRIDVARTLVNHLPNTCSALATGELSAAHATVIAKETAAAIRDGLSEFAIFSIEQKAIAHAEFHTPSQVAQQVRSAIAKFAPATFEEVVEKARDCRRVSCYNDIDGMSTVVAILPAADAQTVMKAIEAFIIKGSAAWEISNDLNTSNSKTSGSHSTGSNTSGSHSTGSNTSGSHSTGSNTSGSNTSGSKNSDSRSADMKRADALTAIAGFALAASSEDVALHRRPITVNVTIDLPTLLGLSENPGQLAGYGAIPASVARALASDGKWKRFITDPQTGALLDYGRETYQPPQALIDFLIARDRTCRFPGCRRSAALSDLDHAQSWEEGGTTSLDNLGALCRRHHLLKTHGGWGIESRADGSCTWTSPLGKIYQTPARSIAESV
jgi:hypothetical protein